MFFYITSDPTLFFNRILSLRSISLSSFVFVFTALDDPEVFWLLTPDSEWNCKIFTFSSKKVLLERALVKYLL